MMKKAAIQFSTILLLPLFFTLHGCSQKAVKTELPLQALENKTLACKLFFSELDDSIKTHEVSDAAAQRISGFPYLRVNRLLSSFRNDLTDEIRIAAWLNRLQILALSAWQFEFYNLPDSEQQRLNRLSQQIDNTDFMATLKSCAARLRQIELNTVEQRQSLLRQAEVPDDYLDWQRVIGLYPLTSLFFRAGIDSWHDDARALFAMKKEQLSVHGELIAYTPDKSFSSSGVIRITDRADIDNHDALGIPDPSTSVLQQLFANYAPTFEIDTVTNDDRIGMVKLDEAFTPYIDTSKPSLYQYVSYTRLAGQVLLQLNYVIWFPARTRTSALDLLGGHLDGITWRVTLLPDGNPLLFDSIHNCGCYHLLFPTQFTAIKTDRDGYEEPLLFAQQLEFPEQSKVHIRLSSGAHYIERVSFTASDVTKTVRYAIQDEDSLRSLLTPAGKRKSLYGPDGIIDSSARGERFLFWPMGVPSPGAMRQPGTHATAFVGRRHFDDAFLFQPYLDTRQLE